MSSDEGLLKLRWRHLEKFQILVYLVFIVCGAFVGFAFPSQVEFLQPFLWPLLALLLYSTFAQVPLLHIKRAISNYRFIAAALLGNFLIIPIFVWTLIPFLPQDPAIKFGVLLVLLVPCTDWFITFTHLGKGDTGHAIAFTPLSLLLQLVLLPFYIWLFLGQSFFLNFFDERVLYAFSTLIVLPLLLAFFTEKWVEGRKDRDRVLESLAWFPVPLLAIIVFVIASTQINLIVSSSDVLFHLASIFIVFLIVAGIIARIVARIFDLPTTLGRVLAFSFGTRNSFVVLPIVVALGSSYHLAVVAIVFQSLVELIGMVVYLSWIPKSLFPEKTKL